MKYCNKCGFQYPKEIFSEPQVHICVSKGEAEND